MNKLWFKVRYVFNKSSFMSVINMKTTYAKITHFFGMKKTLEEKQ